MQLYAILRRSAWATGDELQSAAARSTAEGEKMQNDVRWIRSYVLNEEDDRVGTICLYEATSPEAIRKHAQRAGLAADEVVPVSDTVVIRPDPA